MDGRGVLLTAVTILGSLLRVSGQSCGWIETCQTRFAGSCGSGQVVVDASHDCQGLCTEPEYPACLPFFTCFRCCIEEVFKWIPGDWSECTVSCGGGSRRRTVRCLEYLEFTYKIASPMHVHDSKCLASTMPAREESCNSGHCPGTTRHPKHNHQLMPVWAILLLSFASMAGAGGLAFSGYVY